MNILSKLLYISFPSLINILAVAALTGCATKTNQAAQKMPQHGIIQKGETLYLSNPQQWVQKNVNYPKEVTKVQAQKDNSTNVPPSKIEKVSGETNTVTPTNNTNFKEGRKRTVYKESSEFGVPRIHYSKLEVSTEIPVPTTYSSPQIYGGNGGVIIPPTPGNITWVKTGTQITQTPHNTEVVSKNLEGFINYGGNQPIIQPVIGTIKLNREN